MYLSAIYIRRKDITVNACEKTIITQLYIPKMKFVNNLTTKLKLKIKLI